ncbi:MAG: ATP-binding protein, partial [Dehalococcoidales bacterium]|nr:ATP-binding protein [Dehalococcoidales bacterium]
MTLDKYNFQRKQIESDTLKLFASLGRLPDPQANPVLIALSGLPGTGKSFLGQKLAERLPVIVLESDSLRKTLFPQPTYHWRESARLFRACYNLIEQLLKQKIAVLFDATNLSERYRKRLFKIARRNKAKFILVRVKAPREVVRQRLFMREKDPFNLSDADWNVYLKMAPREEKIRLKHLTVDTSKDI